MTDAIVTELRPSIPSPVSPGEGRPSKDRTNAARQRRYRAKRAATRKAASKPPAEGFAAPSPIAKQAVAVTPASASPAVTSLRNGGADVAAYLAALALARAAAWFSVRGMVVLFPGSPLSVVGMSCAMEAAKLVTAGWLARRWRATAWLWRLVLVALVAGLAVINATGVYAQLVAAHVGQRGEATSAVETQEAALAARIDVARSNVADLDRRLEQIDRAVEEATRRGKTATALSVMEGQRKARAGLVDERRREAGALAALQAERAGVAAKGRQIETEAAPIRYVAELVGRGTRQRAGNPVADRTYGLVLRPAGDCAHGRSVGTEINPKGTYCEIRRQQFQTALPSYDKPMISFRHGECRPSREKITCKARQGRHK